MSSNAQTSVSDWSHAVLRKMFRSLQRTGSLLWLVNRFIPMAASVKSILNAVVVMALVV
jgi:hypothetical protein